MTTTTASSSTAPRSKGLHIGLWVVQVLLALFALMAGFGHGVVPIEEAAKNSPWITTIPVWLARFIGFAELAAGFGLILPAATRIAPKLTPLAAVGLAIIMTLAAGLHVVRGEANVIIIHIVVVALSVFVAWGRFKKAPITPRS